jgi:hypothetical protein
MRQSNGYVSRALQIAIAVVIIAAHARTSAAQSCWADVGPHASPPVILPTPRVFSLYWGRDFWNAATVQRGDLDATWSDLANTQAFWGRLMEYGVRGGSFGGSAIFDPSIVQGSGIYIDDNAIEGEVANDALSLPLAWDGNDLLVVYLPPGVTSSNDDPVISLGHHGSFVTPYGSRLRFAVVDFGATDTMTVVSSHEISEAATDPDVGSGYWSGSSGAEIGDMCTFVDSNGQITTIDTYRWDGHLIQEVWSQGGCGCIQQPPVPPKCTRTPKICCSKPNLAICNGGGD